LTYRFVKLQNLEKQNNELLFGRKKLKYSRSKEEADKIEEKYMRKSCTRVNTSKLKIKHAKKPPHS